MAADRSGKMWLWQRHQTPANIRRLVDFVASGFRPAQSGWPHLVFSVGGQFHNSALSESSFEGFITTICRICTLVDPRRCR
jgi:hypothetical protein